MTTARTIDAHRHLGWDEIESSAVEELLADMDLYGVATSVLVPNARQLAVDNREGNDAVLGAARSHPGRFAVMCAVNPWYGDRALDELRRATGEGAIGLKLHPSLQGFCLTDPVVRPVLAQAAELGLVVYVHTGTPPYAQPLQVAHLARTFTDTTFIMGHAGSTDLKADALAALDLAHNLIMESSWMLPARLELTVQRVGADRVMFGSDAPLSSLSLELANHWAARLPAGDMCAVLGGTAADVLGLAA